MPDQLQAGPALDEIVGKLLSWEPELHWGVGKKAEHSWTYLGNEWCCRDWFARHQREYPKHAAGMDVYSVELWPAVSTDGNAMLLAIDEMRKKGFRPSICDFQYPLGSVDYDPDRLESGWRCSFVIGGNHCEATTLPLAVALAIRNALDTSSTSR